MCSPPTINTNPTALGQYISLEIKKMIVLQSQTYAKLQSKVEIKLLGYTSIRICYYDVLFMIMGQLEFCHFGDFWEFLFAPTFKLKSLTYLVLPEFLNFN